MKKIISLTLALLLSAAVALPFVLGDNTPDAGENYTADTENNEVAKEEMITEQTQSTENTVVSDVTVSGGLSMAKVFADGMVLQRQKPINVFGYANNGSTVNVTLGESTATATASDGKWQATLPAMEAAKGLTLTVTAGTETLTFKNVDIGEVFVVSGQSNAQYSAYQLEDWDEFSLLADTYKNIRIFAETSYYVVEEDKYGYGIWMEANKDTLGKGGPADGNVSAVGYVMATKLAQELGPDITVALINVARSATNINAWIAEDKMREDPATYGDLPERIQSYQDFYAANGRLPASTAESPYYVSGKSLYHFLPCVCYNAMIAPLVGYTARSVVWYQGESNVAEGNLYTKKFADMRDNFIEAFANEDLSFFIVQLAPYNRAGDVAAFEAIQYDIALNTPNTYIVSTGVDGTPMHLQDVLYGPPPSLIHPSRKTPLGQRTADRIMVEVFGKEDEILTAPKLLSVTRGEGTVVLTFDTELRLLRGVTVEDFQVRDSSGIWQNVNGSIAGNTVVLNTSHLNGTTQVRYGFGARSIELATGELLPLDVGNGLTLSGNTIIYNYGGRYYEFNSEDGQVIRVIKAGNLTNASGEPMPTFVATVS